MTKAAKQSIFILIFLLIGSLGFTGFMVFVEKPRLEQEKANLQTELKKTKKSEQDFAAKAKSFEDKSRKLEGETKQLTAKLNTSDRKVKNLETQVKDAVDEREKFKRRFETANETRDNLLAQVDKLNQEIEILKSENIEIVEQANPDGEEGGDGESGGKVVYDRSKTVDEEYWKSLVVEQQNLQAKIKELKDQLSESSVEVVDLRQENTDLQLEIEDIKAAKERIDRELKHKLDMIDNLALEVARAKNDRKFVADRVDKLNTENEQLRTEIKKLVSAKGSLEKSILRLSTDKDKIERQLGKTENIIQSKIDEIWEIKESLDNTIRTSRDEQPATSSIELSPIVVSSSEQGGVVFDSGMKEAGFNGNVLSINSDNNFIIVDIGQKDGINLGEQLSVYRSGKYIARLEVIQVRKDISAADIKEQWSKIKEGDVVR